MRQNSQKELCIEILIYHRIINCFVFVEIRGTKRFSCPYLDKM